MSNVHHEIDGAIGRITLNRPERMNAVSVPLARELGEAIRQVGNHRDVRVVVIRGAWSFEEQAEISAQEVISMRYSGSRPRGRQLYTRCSPPFVARARPSRMRESPWLLRLREWRWPGGSS